MKIKAHSGLSLAVLITALIIGCRDGNHMGNNDHPPDVVILSPLKSKAVTVTVELALTAEQRAMGLMYRKQLDPASGMLFIFDEERVQSFWMKNTIIELDMIFIRSDMMVAGCVERAEPQTLSPRHVEERSLYVLEVVGGFCKQHGIDDTTGVKFSLPSISMER